MQTTSFHKAFLGIRGTLTLVYTSRLTGSRKGGWHGWPTFLGREHWDDGDANWAEEEDGNDDDLDEAELLDWLEGEDWWTKKTKQE